MFGLAYIYINGSKNTEDQTMSNAAFDRLAWAQDLKNARTTLKNMQDAEASGEASDYTRRSIPAEMERISYLEANRPL